MSFNKQTNTSPLDDLLTLIDAEEYQPSYKNAVFVLGFNRDEGHVLARFLHKHNSKHNHDVVPTNKPQLFDDNTQNFYACPEFGTLQNFTDQLFNAHFLRKIIKDAMEVKFLITTNYAKLSNNKDTLELFNNVANFIRFVPKYKDSIILVIQDVNTDVRDATIQKVINHLNVLKHHHVVSKNVRYLIDALVVENYITTIPELTAISAVAAEDAIRGQLNDFINNKPFQRADDFDFQYVFNFAISGDTRRMIETTVKKLFASVTENLNKVVDHANIFVDGEVSANYNNFKKLTDLLDKYTDDLASLQWQRPETVEKFSEDLIRLNKYLILDNSKIGRHVKEMFKDIYDLALIESYLTNNNDTLINTIRGNLEKLYAKILKVKSNVLGWYRWTHYLLKVSTVLSRANHKEAIDIFDSLKRNDTEKYWRSLETRAKVNRNDFSLVVYKLDDIKYKMLYEMTKLKAEAQVEQSCEGDTCRFEGDNIFITDIGQLPCDCKRIEMFAYESLIFNSDVSVRPAVNQLTIIAPMWDVYPPQTCIDMYGKDANRFIKPYRAPRGTDGQAGYPGFPSPNFYGIMKERPVSKYQPNIFNKNWVNKGRVIVRSFGGKGGPGQNADGSNSAGPGGRGGKNGFYLMYETEQPKTTGVVQIIEKGKDGRPGRSPNSKTNSNYLIPQEDPEIPEIGAVVERYRNALRHKIDRPFQRTPLDEFLNSMYNTSLLIDQYANFENYFGVKISGEKYRAELMQVFNNLEEHFSHHDNRKHLAKFYQLFLKDILKFTEVYNNATDEGHFYRFLYSTIFTKFVALQNRDNAMIIDFNAYLNLIIDNINKQEDFNKIINIKTALQVHEKSLNEKINEAMKFTAEVYQDIDVEVTKIEEEIQKFIKEIEKVTQKFRDHRDKLIAEEEKMKRNILINRIFGIFKVITSVISLLGPIGAVVGAVTTTALAIGETFAKQDELDTTLPESLKNIGKQVDVVCNTVLDEKTKSFNDEVKNLQKELKKIKEAQEDEADTKAEAKEIAEALDYAANDLENPNKAAHERNALQRKLKKELREKEAKLEERQKKNDKVLKKLKHFNDAASVVQESLNVYKTWKNDDSKLSEIGKKIRETEKTIKDLEVYRDKVEEVVGPLLDQLRDDLKKVDLSGKSQAALDVKRWNIKSTLTDMKIYMRQLLMSIDNTDVIRQDIAQYIDKLEDTMNTIINIYERIEALQERKQLYQYIAYVSSEQSQFDQITDVKLREQLETMHLNMQESLVILQYETYMDQIKQWVFPFAARYLPGAVSKTDIQPHITKENKRSLFDKYVKNIQLMKNTFDSYKSVIVREYDSSLFFSYFLSKYKSTRPFFTWTKERYSNVINALLRGREVYLSAHIDAGHANKFGLKFNVIGLEFTTDDPTEQAALIDILENVKIVMTHTGNSYYRCENEIYMITNEPQTFHFSYEFLEGSTDPITANDVYKKLKTADLILSPWTTWKIQLTTEYGSENVFQKLAQFESKVNVALTGKGHYTTDRNVCNNMEQYEENKVTHQEKNHPLMYMEPFVLHSETNYTVDDIIDKYRNLKVVDIEPQVEHRSPIVAPNVVNSVTRNVFNWFYDKWNSTSASASFSPTYDTNSSLLLLDVMYKKFTNKKFEPIGVRRNVPLLVLQAEAIKLTSGLENIINTLVLYSEGLEHFNPVVTQKELMRLLRTSDAKTINNYLIATVKRSVPLASIAEIEQHLRDGDLLG